MASTAACAVCQAPAPNRCSKCKNIWYCGVEHQRQHWKAHKAACNDSFQADQHTMHKQAFDTIIQKHKLQEKAGEISEFLTATPDITATVFAEQYGMNVEEAVVFLEWINVGVKFKEETLDVAKKAGLTGDKR